MLASAAVETKKTFRIILWYFKASGKFYAESSFEWHGAAIIGNGPEPTCYMNDVVSHVRGLRDGGERGAMPGLMGSGWEGPILINCEQGYPCLLLPSK